MIEAIITTEKNNNKKTVIYGITEDKLELLNTFYAIIKNKYHRKFKSVKFKNEIDLEKYSRIHKVDVLKISNEEYTNEISKHFNL